MTLLHPFGEPDESRPYWHPYPSKWAWWFGPVKDRAFIALSRRWKDASEDDLEDAVVTAISRYAEQWEGFPKAGPVPGDPERTLWNAWKFITDRASERGLKRRKRRRQEEEAAYARWAETRSYLHLNRETGEVQEVHRGPEDAPEVLTRRERTHAVVREAAGFVASISDERDRLILGLWGIGRFEREIAEALRDQGYEASQPTVHRRIQHFRSLIQSYVTKQGFWLDRRGRPQPPEDGED